MKVKYGLPLPGRATALLAVLLLVCLAAIPLAVACGGGGEKTPTPSGTPKATATAKATPKATATAKPTAAATRTATPTAVPTATATPTAAATPTATTEPTVKPAVTPGPGITDTEIILGADNILGGAMGAVYATITDATSAYFKYVNDTQGGVCGRKIVYKVEDNQDDPAKGLEAVRKLVEQDKVFAIVGSLGDAPHAAVWDYLNENSVPDILVSAGASTLRRRPRGASLDRPDDPQLQQARRRSSASTSLRTCPARRWASSTRTATMGLDGLQG